MEDEDFERIGGEQENVIQIGFPKEGVNSVKDGNEHQAYGSKRVKMTFDYFYFCYVPQ